MNRYAIQDKMIIQWDGTQDNHKIEYALKFINRETVDVNWRWLNDDLMELYEKNPNEGAACASWISGWITGASNMLSKVLLNHIK